MKPSALPHQLQGGGRILWTFLSTHCTQILIFNVKMLFFLPFLCQLSFSKFFASTRPSTYTYTCGVGVLCKKCKMYSLLHLDTNYATTRQLRGGASTGWCVCVCEQCWVLQKPIVRKGFHSMYLCASVFVGGCICVCAGCFARFSSIFQCFRNTLFSLPPCTFAVITRSFSKYFRLLPPQVSSLSPNWKRSFLSFSLTSLDALFLQKERYKYRTKERSALLFFHKQCVGGNANERIFSTFAWCTKVNHHTVFFVPHTCAHTHALLLLF